MVCYFSEDTSFSFNRRRVTSSWLREVCLREGKILKDVNIIFCSDTYLLDINRKFLNHNYFTDIITFDYCVDSCISGDLFISVDSVRENSIFYNTLFDNELNRVIVHGILHLVGFDDHTEEEVTVMRGKEDCYLSLLSEF